MLFMLAALLPGSSPAPGAVSLPQFTPTAGTYSSDQAVTITTPTAGAAIHYTTDGTTPTAASATYSAPISVAGHGTAMTIQAIAVMAGMTESAVATANYTINYSQVSTPQFSPAAGTYGPDQNVTITTSTAGATIHYTTNGTTPTAASATYSTPISVAGNGTNMTVKAIAVKNGMASSTVASAGYILNYPDIRYVSTTGNDANTGLSPTSPKLTIPAAITAATAPAAVLVAKGTYNVDSKAAGAGATHVILKEGVSLYGGYSADFSTYNPAANTTTITDTSTTWGSTPNFNRALEAGAGITSATVVDGFTINGASSVGQANNMGTAVFAHGGGAPTLSNNAINGGGDAFESCSAIYSDLSSPVISGNTISGCGSISPATGSANLIMNVGSSPTIANNTINLIGYQATGINNAGGSNPSITGNQINGNLSGFFMGISNDASSPTISNNLITSAANTSQGAQGIYSANGSAPAITNNTIHCGTSPNAGQNVGIYNMGGTGIVVKNNIINAGTAPGTMGIYENTTNSVISDNSISAGTATGGTYGVMLQASTSTLSNNVIDGGVSSGASTYGIWFDSDSNPTVLHNTISGGSSAQNSYAVVSGGAGVAGTTGTFENNIIFTTGGTTRYCMVEWNATADPVVFQNNDLFNCPTALYYDEGTTAITDLVTNIINGATSTLGNWGNVSVDPLFVNQAGGDWHLTASSPVDVREGGLNLTATVTKDKDAVSRTAVINGAPTNAGAAGVSIGAYEKD